MSKVANSERRMFDLRSGQLRGILKSALCCVRSFLFLVVRQEPLVASLLLVAMPKAPSSFLFSRHVRIIHSNWSPAQSKAYGCHHPKGGTAQPCPETNGNRRKSDSCKPMWQRFHIKMWQDLSEFRAARVGKSSDTGKKKSSYVKKNRKERSEGQQRKRRKKRDQI